jgi:hypothetical protein
VLWGVCPPHRGCHGRTTRAPAQCRGAQGEGRVGRGRPSTPVQRGQQYKHYKGQSPVEHRPCRIIYALAGGSCISYRGKAKGRALRGSVERGQGQYKGWGPTPSFATARESYPSRELLQRCYMRAYCG